MENDGSFRISPALKQLIVSGAVYVAFFAKGTGTGFLTVLMPQLQHDNSTLVPSIDEGSWIVSIHGLFYLPTALFVPTLMQSHGRRMAFRISQLPMLISWFLTYLATSSSWLMVAGALQGLSMSGSMLVGPIAIAEYTTPKYRGMFLVSKAFMFFLGIWFSNALGSHLHWRTLSLVLCPVPFLTLLLTLTWPESPLWLASKGEYEAAKKSFRWLRGTGLEAEKELMILIDVQKKSLEKSDRKNQRVKAYLQMLKTKVQRKDFQHSTLIVMFLFSLYHLCGRLTIASYFIKVVTAMTGSQPMAYKVLHISNPMHITAMLISVYLVKIFRRRPLLYLTSCFGAAFLMVTSLILYLQQVGLVPHNSWFSLVPFFLYLVCTSLGPTMIPTSMYAEFIPLQHKDLTNTIGFIHLTFLHWGTHKILPYLLLYLDVAGTFLAFAICTIICVAFLYTYMPESANRTLQEIEDYYNFGYFINRKGSDSVSLAIEKPQ